MPDYIGGSIPTVRTPVKTITFTGGAGAGAVGSVTIWTVTGIVLVKYLLAICTTTLTGATAIMALGVTGSTSLFIGGTTATTITSTNKHWMTPTPATGGLAIPSAVHDVVISADVIATITTAAVGSGVIDFYGWFEPLTATGNMT